MFSILGRNFLWRHSLPEAQAHGELLLFSTGTQRWACILGFAFPRSRVPGILGTRARGNTNFVQELENAEREKTGTFKGFVDTKVSKMS